MAVKEPTPNWGEHLIFKALQLRYREPEWALLAQVKNTAGYGKVERFADAFAFGLWPSRGLSIVGFEFKSSRSDWLRELNDPAKSDPTQAYCDFWFICAGAVGIVDVAELPPTWGLMVPAGKKMKVLVKAPKLEDPKSLTRGFVTSVIRRVYESKSSQAELKQAWSDGEKKGLEWGFKQAEKNRKYEMERLQNLEKKVREFEDASGIDVRHHWDLGSVGRAVRIISSADGVAQLTAQAGVMERGAAELRRAVAEMTKEK